MSSQKSEDVKRGRGRPRNFAEAEVLDALTDTFWRNGYAATSLDDLTQATGAARASLYKLFGDKDALLVAAIDHYAARFDTRVDATCASAGTAREAIAQTLRASADRLSAGQAPPGCLRCRITLDRHGQSPAIGAALDRANDKFRHNMERLLAVGTDPAALHIPKTALFLTTIVNGMVILAEAGASRDDLEDVITTALANVPET